ncbi:MAG TPA: SAM-dependent methyltransferase [Chryseolinea sp.]|nr:SAM-dependent methyltransferase [Chryseolinea sp.]
MNKGKLYLIPNVIADNTFAEVLPPHIYIALNGIHNFLVEDVRTARRYLSGLKIYDSIESLDFKVLNKDSRSQDMPALFEPIFRGLNIGVVSEAGCPGVADPGALAAQFAHQNDIQVIPLVGPSSILLALMASGLNGQRFAFHGYLPIDAKECAKAIQDFERESTHRNQTQIFIETPYRNNHVKDLLIKNLKHETLLSIALDLTGVQENIRTFPVKKWKQSHYDMPKAPAVFLFLSF